MIPVGMKRLMPGKNYNGYICHFKQRPSTIITALSQLEHKNSIRSRLYVLSHLGERGQTRFPKMLGIAKDSLFDEFGGVAGDGGEWLDVFGHDCASGDDCALADGDAWQDDCPRADPYAIANLYRRGD